MSVFVKPNNRVDHDGKIYEAGEQINDIDDKQEKSLLQAGVVQTQPIGDGVSNIVVPTDEEVAATVAAAEEPEVR